MTTISTSTTTTTAYVCSPDTTGTLVLQTGSTPTTAMTIDTSQRVGIGISSPQAYLHVQATSGLTPQIKLGQASSYQLQLGYNNSAEYGFLQAYAANLSTPDDIILNPSGGNVGIGTSTPQTKLQADGTSAGALLNVLTLRNGSSVASSEVGIFFTPCDQTTNIRGAQITAINDGTNNIGLKFYTGAGASITEKMRIDSSGNLLVGKTVTTSSVAGAYLSSGGILNSTQAAGSSYANFYNASGTSIGFIANNGNASTTYSTTSDYRLKENIQPMTGALDVIAQLKPVTYTWKADGSDGQGFIAHELQEVVPDCVTGEKDAVDADGNPVYQGIDTSFLVATLTAAIQEQQTLIQQLTQRIETLEAK